MGSSKRTILLIIIIFIFICATLSTIHVEAIWFDEGYSYLAAKLSMKDLLFSNPEPDVHPFFFYGCGKFWMEIFGDSPYVLRYMTVCIGLIAVVAIFFVSRKWYDENVGLASSFLFATSLTIIRYSEESRMYIALILLATLSFHFLKEQKWLWFILITASMEYFHYYAVFIIIAHIILAYSLNIEWKKFVKAYFFVYLLMIPAVIYFVFQNYGMEGMWLTSPLPMTVPSAFLFQLFIAGSTAFSNVHGVLPFLFFGIFMCFLLLQRFGRLEYGMFFSWFLGISVFLVLAYSPLSLPYHHRFALMFAPLLYILLGRSLATAFVNWKAFGIVLVCFWVAVQGFMYYQYYSNPDDELGHAAEFMKPYCLNHSIILHDTPFSLLPFMVYVPKCINVLETNVTMNELRTCGGAVVEPKYINNVSLVPDFYLTSSTRLPSKYASGEVVFRDDLLVVLRVNKSSYSFKEHNVSRTVRSLNLTRILRNI